MTRSMRFGGWKLLPACLLLAGCAGVPLGSNPNQSEETALRQLEHSRIAAGDAMRSTQAAFQILAQNIAYSDIPAYKALRAELAPGGKVKVHVDLRQGELTPTDQDMDVAIRGDGFFKVIWRTPDGREVVAYTREGAFFTDSNGQFQLHNAGSYKLDPPVSIPGNTMVITITPDGKVLVTLSGNPTPNLIGQIQLAVFAHPDELEYRDGFFWETKASGAPNLWNPGSAACGTLVQRSMERSNVVVNEEMAYLVKLSRWNQKLRQDLGLPVTQQAVGSTRETNPYLKLALAGLTQARETAQRNLANARTVGYKYETPLIHEGGVVQIRRNFARGEFAITGHELDVAIDGDGFFQVKLGEGDKLGYTRAGSLIVGKDGYLCSPAGYLLEPPVAIPADATAIMIGVDGRMLVTPAVNPTPVPVGQIQLARFVNPQGLAVKDGIYSVTEASGLPIVCNPGLEGTGMLKQGTLEMSNVSLNQESAQLSTLDYWQQVLEEAEKLAQERSPIPAWLADRLGMPQIEKTRPLTEFELHVLETQRAGVCELVANEAHFTRVVRDGMAKAQISLDIMTADFKAMLVPLGRKGAKARSVVELFRTLANRGVEIRIMHAGTPSGPALVELKKIGREDATAAARGNLTIRRCPRLHAKAVIIDTRAMYLGSANLTGAGLGAKGADKRNFELGIWTDAAPLIEGVMEQFNMLWEGHRCKQCRRKDVCPVPLEEPRL